MAVRAGNLARPIKQIRNLPMTHSSFPLVRMLELANILESSWNIEFDPHYDDLEREFAELRFQNNHAA